jgi:hypothetical protein
MLSLLPSGKQALVSNVLIPDGLLGPGTPSRAGGLTLVDLESYQTTPITGTTDTNGLALAR